MASTKTLRIDYVPRLRLGGQGDWKSDPLGGLGELRLLQRALDKAMRDTVDSARKAGHSWSDIGGALKISRQSAWERFSQNENPPPPSLRRPSKGSR